jgi:hypothetical protein
MASSSIVPAAPHQPKREETEPAHSLIIFLAVCFEGLKTQTLGVVTSHNTKFNATVESNGRLGRRSAQGPTVYPNGLGIRTKFTP